MNHIQPWKILENSFNIQHTSKFGYLVREQDIKNEYKIMLIFTFEIIFLGIQSVKLKNYFRWKVNPKKTHEHDEKSLSENIDPHNSTKT